MRLVFSSLLSQSVVCSVAFFSFLGGAGLGLILQLLWLVLGSAVRLVFSEFAVTFSILFCSLFSYY
jgi:hypothetical protein